MYQCLFEELPILLYDLVFKFRFLQKMYVIKQVNNDRIFSYLRIFHLLFSKFRDTHLELVQLSTDL